ncbi:phenylacetate--CoA ligase family protein [uncultured Proteiniphilum sp.]|uniref:phenylacetate--CoA ligase family protein n=1 Tax=uncultured Proteiniphilum sp. TaxID=497637 RepID=UPI002609E626|nr:phenylacetate--CoA ligase family protein [uncultured Proteiniphilum sp.]
MKGEYIYQTLPHFFQNLMVSLYNKLMYKKRYGGEYKEYLDRFIKNRTLSLTQLKEIQNERFVDLVNFSKVNSPFYRSLYNNIETSSSVNEISKLPILDKELLRKEIDNVRTISSRQAIHSKTGGTTGKSLEVYFTTENMQERFAMLDDFRGRYGYELGKKTAWFSGKSLLTKRDVRKHRFWKTDLVHKVRYYSTFHIKEDNLKYYLEDIIQFQPEYLVGFPSNILEIAKYGTRYGYKYPERVTKAIFPTAETITSEMREIIEPFFHSKMFNQYASSEGAPFIFECSEGNLHLELQSGVFEVLDDDDQPTTSGKLIVTSFTTYGTPLIRYDIGDSITLENENKTCSCGNKNPMVREILGRIDDYIFSPENGKINLGNVSNTLKDTKGIIRFQVIQNELNTLELFVETDKVVYNKKIEDKFLQNWRDRVGNKMEISIHYVDNIPVEKSGKFRIVKNNIKHLLSE